MSLKMNTLGTNLIKEFEGLYLRAYKCPANVWTVGWGTTIYPNGRAVRSGDTCTREQAEQYLKHDIETKYSLHVRQANIFPKLRNDNEFSALVSFVYNVGRGGVHAPNSINRRIANGEDYRTVVETELPRWNKGNGRVLAGLVRRRQAEIALFQTAVSNQDKFFIGLVSDEVKGFQKALNVWLKKFNKTLLTVDGWFGQKSLDASNDFARNNRLPVGLTGVDSALADTILLWAKKETGEDTHNMPDIKVYNRSQAELNISDNFKAGEFFCKCGRCQDQLISTSLVEVLQKLRMHLNKPILLNSGFRCKNHNKNVGGSPASRHMTGDAVDIRLTNLGLTDRQLAKVIQDLGHTKGGFGWGGRRGFLHIDMRGHYVEWNY